MCRTVVSSMEWRYARSWAQDNSQLMRVTAFIITESMTQISVMTGTQSTANANVLTANVMFERHSWVMGSDSSQLPYFSVGVGSFRKG